MSRALLSLPFVWAFCAGAVYGQIPTADELLKAGLEHAGHGDLQGAAATLQEGHKAFPADNSFTAELAGVAYREKQFRKAKAYLKDVLRNEPKHEYANFFLGSLYLSDGNLAATLKYWNRIDQPLLQNVGFVPRPHLEKVLQERTFSVSGGQIFTLKRLLTTETAVDRLGVFAEHSFELVPRKDERYDLTIRTLPAGPILQGAPGYLLSSLREIVYQRLDFDFYNLGGQGVNLFSLWRWDRNKRRAEVSLEGSARSGHYRFVADVRGETWDRRRSFTGVPGDAASLRLKKAEVFGEITFPLSEKLAWTTGMEVSRRQFGQSDGTSVFANGWLADVRNRFDYLLWLWPDSRIRVDAAGTVRVGRLWAGPPSPFLSAEAVLKAKWFPQAKGDVYSVQAILRTGATLNNVPLDEMFMLGMERDSDLWLRGHVATRDGRKGNGPLGTKYALSQLETDRRVAKLLTLDVRMGPFLDTGWTGGTSNRAPAGGWLCDAGLQVKVAAGSSLHFSAVYGRDLRHGGGVFYTAVSR